MHPPTITRRCAPLLGHEGAAAVAARIHIAVGRVASRRPTARAPPGRHHGPDRDRMAPARIRGRHAHRRWSLPRPRDSPQSEGDGMPLRLRNCGLGRIAALQTQTGQEAFR